MSKSLNHLISDAILVEIISGGLPSITIANLVVMADIAKPEDDGSSIFWDIVYPNRSFRRKLLCIGDMSKDSAETYHQIQHFRAENVSCKKQRERIAAFLNAHRSVLEDVTSKLKKLPNFWSEETFNKTYGKVYRKATK